MPTLNIGLTDEQRQGVIDLLNRDLADAYLLLVKTKKFHWDVVGPQFLTLHKLWEGHYNALTINIDALAERIRTLGGYPIGTMKGFLGLTSLSEHPGDVPMATGMVEILIGDHEQVVCNLREHIDQCSDSFHDEGTADFLTGLMEQHEQIAWMLRSFIEGDAVVANGSRIGLSSRSKVGV
jgi:starvation-inducible DNA-binding protein